MSAAETMSTDDRLAAILAPVAEVVAQVPSPILERFTAATLTTAQLKAQEPAAALVEGFLLLDSTAMVYGPSGGGKTFTMVDLASHVATGSWWWGQKVHGGAVIYVVAEGAGRFGPRVDAWEHHHHTSVDIAHPVYWLPIPVNLHDPATIGAFIEYAQAREPVLIVFDTLARCTLGVEENSAKEMGQVIHHVDLIRRETGACVVMVHHTGHAEGRARGSSALRAAVDTELEVAGTDGRITLKVTKQKDGTEPLPRHFTLAPAGESCALRPSQAGDPDKLPAGARATLEALAAVEVPGGVPASVWKASAAVADRTFYNHRRGLLVAGQVVNLGTDHAPRYIVAQAADGAQ